MAPDLTAPAPGQRLLGDGSRRRENTTTLESTAANRPAEPTMPAASLYTSNFALELYSGPTLGHLLPMHSRPGPDTCHFWALFRLSFTDKESALSADKELALFL